MLLSENYTAEYILRLREETGADPSILERTVFAFGLLEAIRSVGMPFIFKGGTSLLVIYAAIIPHASVRVFHSIYITRPLPRIAREAICNGP